MEDTFSDWSMLLTPAIVLGWAHTFQRALMLLLEANRNLKQNLLSINEKE